LTGRREFIQPSPHQVGCETRNRRSGPTICDAAPYLDKNLRHEHIEVCGGVLAERTAQFEAIAPIERMRGLEGLARARLEKKT